MNEQQHEGLLPEGTLLSGGKYRVEAYLASGGFGNTYLANDMAFNEKVVIKELFIKGVCGRDHATGEVSISLSENRRTFDAQREKFRKEAQRLRKLNNPHIVRVHDLFDERGTTFYVMDYIDGESLSKRLKRTELPLQESEVMQLLPQVLDALQTVHGQHMWHLDLKPANIMVDRKGNVLLIDFGASKQLRSADGASLSTSSAMSYTPGYAPTEQTEQNMEKFGPWTDLYALGATIYNLLTRQTPPMPSDIDENADEALKLPTAVSRKTCELVKWLMKPNRTMRPQNVEQVTEFLKEGGDSVPPKDVVHETPVTDDDSTRTKVREGAQRPQRQGNEKAAPTTATKPAKTQSLRVLQGILVVFALIIVATGIWAVVRNIGGEETGETSGTESVETVPMKEVKDMPMTVYGGPQNMRTYKYTGPIEDRVGALPQGNGKAVYSAQGQIPGSTYTGAFKDGLCEDPSGNAKLVFDSGDTFVGTFVGGFYDKGRYTLSDGNCFEGSFKESRPYNGKWYNPDGSFSATVVNGVER